MLALRLQTVAKCMQHMIDKCGTTYSRGRRALPPSPACGTGITMPLAIRAMLTDNGVPEGRVPELLADVEGLETAITEALS